MSEWYKQTEWPSALPVDFIIILRIVQSLAGILILPVVILKMRERPGTLCSEVA